MGPSLSKLEQGGISEHKILKDSLPSNNIEIAGYEEFIFKPTETTHGGTGFYLKDTLDYDKRNNLQIN
jgi:exonuclease III